MSREPVTVVVTRRVKPGREQEYEEWLSRLINFSKTMPGYLGTDIYRPAATGPREYTTVFRYESVETLRAFEESETRRRALIEVTEFVDSDAVFTKFTGLEFWFTPPPGTVVPQPSRFRMALVMIVVVYGMVMSIGQLLGLVLGGMPLALRLLITIFLQVPLMTYIVMPTVTRLFARWIYPKSSATA